MKMTISNTNSTQHTNNHNAIKGIYNASNADLEVPVLIVGGGPCGLLLAYLLSRLGVKSLIVERYPKRLSAPKAHALSPRSLEICRQFGLDTNRIRQLGTCRNDAYWVNFVTNLAGERVGVLPYERMDVGVLDDTPEMIHNVPQPVFEEYVASHLQRNPSCEIGGHVDTVVEDRGTGNLYKIKSRHVVACDGAKSKVRSSFGIECEGEDSYETMMTIHFNADLRELLGERVGMLHWVMDPEVSGFIIGYDLAGIQVLICNFDGKKHPVETWNEQLCRKTVTAAIGKPIPFDILSFRPWILSRKVANSYRVGNVLLAGDAAHAFPPTGGLGLNSGISDVHNLAYKIAAVHLGWAGDDILDTYESDRRHVAQVNSQQSVKNGKQIFSLLKLMGTTDPDVLQARKNLYRTIGDPRQKKFIDEQIEAQREHFDNLELHIGYVYGSEHYPANASDYKPKYVTGARLPHTWIDIGESTAISQAPVDLSYIAGFSADEAKKRRFSSLDLCAFDSFTFIIGSRSQLTLVTAAKDRLVRHGIPINILVLGHDFETVDGEHGAAWVESLGLLGQGGVLVRPDQHILNILSCKTTIDELCDAVMKHVGL